MTRFLFFSLGVLFSATLAAQSNFLINNDSTAVPFLRISPDARAGGMGDGGVACADDANAMHWNLANLAFVKKKCSFGISYTPWLRALVPDINLAYLSFYLKPDSVSAIAASCRYFSVGTYTIMSNTGQPGGQFRPNEFALDIGYTRKISAHLSAGLAARFIQSNLVGANVFTFQAVKGMACAGDITIAWKGNVVGGTERNVQPAVGFSISNLGTKVWYRDQDSAEFLPTNARLGSALAIAITEYHQLILQAEANRLLVPLSTAQVSFKEKMERATVSGGMEYVYNHSFKFRGGYFHEFRSHGQDRYLTAGLGIEYKVFQLDFSYLIPIGTLRSPLENTIRFSLLFNFDPRKSDRKNAALQNR